MKKTATKFLLIGTMLLAILAMLLYKNQSLPDDSYSAIETVEIEPIEREIFQEEFTILEETQEVEVDTKTEGEEIKDSESQESIVKEGVAVTKIWAERVTREQIDIYFEPIADVKIESYYLLKKENDPNQEAWITVREIKGDIDEGICHISDYLESSEIQQYIYRIDVKPVDETVYEGQMGEKVLASNVLVCIDPGHYAGKNKVTGENAYGYAEGDYTIKIGLALRDILKEQYGIDSYMTRENGSITLSGYTDAGLDSKHISLRGSYAGERDSDLFISLHTNANNDNANGYPTCLQPVEINKTIVLANLIACEREDIINISNSIGVNLSRINYEKGISVFDEFQVGEAGEIKEWTVAYNDSLNTAGSVRCRLGESGDYYGVLKGAGKAGVPGIIVEHGMHTVADLRKEAMNSNLYELWAEADAYGIAYGFGFEKKMLMTEEN